MRDGYGRALAIVALLSLAVPAFAHHAVQAEFDQNKKATIKGVLTKVLWINPHVRWVMDVKDPKTGKVVTWDISGGGPAGFREIGITGKDVFKIGETYTAIIALAKDGSNWACSLICRTAEEPRRITRVDGREVSHDGASSLRMCGCSGCRRGFVGGAADARGSGGGRCAGASGTSAHTTHSRWTSGPECPVGRWRRGGCQDHQSERRGSDLPELSRVRSGAPQRESESRFQNPGALDQLQARQQRLLRQGCRVPGEIHVEPSSPT
jgi:hypothetical protein